MGKFGKGLTLAFFITFSLLPCHAQEADDGMEIAVFHELPVITRLNWQDPVFRQYIAEVEANRRRVINRHSQAGSIIDSLTVYRYVTSEADNIFTLAARCSIPYSALVSLNRLSNPNEIQAGMSLLLPSAPGIFVPAEPQSSLEQLLFSGRQASINDNLAITPGGDGIIFYFFAGSDFSGNERAFFFNPSFRFPLREIRVTSGFGMRESPITGNRQFHQGIDLAAPEGTEVLAAGNGVVTETGFDRILGNFVIVSHADNWASLYGHLQRIDTTLHSTVSTGSVIGRVGSTGLSTGPHLHFELRQFGRARDPDRHLFSPGGS